MIYLGSLNNAALLKKIVNLYNPALIYFICYLGSPDEFKLDSRINDREEDCKKLEDANITRFERPVHLHTGLCDFTTTGRLVYNDLKEYNICKEIYDILHKKDEDGNSICRDLYTFTLLFNENFSFEIDPDNLIEIKRREIINSLQMVISHDNFKILTKDDCKIKGKYKISGENLGCDLKIKCKCSNNWEIEINNIEMNLSSYSYYNFICESCNRIIKLDPLFYYAKSYLGFHQNENL